MVSTPCFVTTLADVCLADARLNQASDALDRQNAVFDESGHFLIYCTMLGVKVVNLVTNKVSRLLGRHENVRFLQATLFQARRASPQQGFASSRLFF